MVSAMTEPDPEPENPCPAVPISELFLDSEDDDMSDECDISAASEEEEEEETEVLTEEEAENTDGAKEKKQGQKRSAQLAAFRASMPKQTPQEIEEKKARFFKVSDTFISSHVL